MQATNVLVEEHRLIERVLDSLEAATDRLENGQVLHPEYFLSAVDFIRGFADGCHHQKEEGILFTRLEAQGIPLQGCPLGVMLAEHELGRQYTRALLSAAQSMQNGDASARQRIIHSTRSYIALLRQHISKEDSILFPMAEDVIPKEQHPLIWEEFGQVENGQTGQGVHEKYLALAEALEQDLIA